MGPAANAAVSTKWRDRMSRWHGAVGEVVDVYAEFCCRSRYRSPRSSAWRKRLVGDRAVANRRRNGSLRA